MKRIWKLVTCSVVAFGLMATPVAANASSTDQMNSVAPLSGGYPECSNDVVVMGPDAADPRITIPSTSGRSMVNCTLNQGTINNSVRALQQAMNQCHGKNLSVDGNFGPATRSALRSVQSAVGTSADGIFGPDTRNKMSFKGNGSTCRTGNYIKANYIAWHN